MYMHPLHTGTTLATRFSILRPLRFVDYNDQQIHSTAGQPLLQKIEFQKIEKGTCDCLHHSALLEVEPSLLCPRITAHLAYATVQNVALPLSNQGADIVQLSLSIHLDPAQDPTPQEASLVNISELPVTHRSAEAVYTLFKQFGMRSLYLLHCRANACTDSQRLQMTQHHSSCLPSPPYHIHRPNLSSSDDRRTETCTRDSSSHLL